MFILNVYLFGRRRARPAHSHHPPDRAAGHLRAGLGALHNRQPARRLELPDDGLVRLLTPPPC